MRKTVFIFGLLIIAIAALLQLSKYALMAGDMTIELIIGVIAVVFFVAGIFIQRRFQSKNASPDSIDQQALETIGLSKREYEILKEMVAGHSNKEIANRLFISENTVKTHVSNIFTKLDAKRRTQAIQKAKDLRIIPQ